MPEQHSKTRSGILLFMDIESVFCAGKSSLHEKCVLFKKRMVESHCFMFFLTLLNNLM